MSAVVVVAAVHAVLFLTLLLSCCCFFVCVCGGAPQERGLPREMRVRLRSYFIYSRERALFKNTTYRSRRHVGIFDSYSSSMLRRPLLTRHTAVISISTAGTRRCCT